MGIMGLKHLLYFAETHPEKFRGIVNRQMEMEGKEQQYPVATAGINVSQMLMTIFGIGNGKKKKKPKH